MSAAKLLARGGVGDLMIELALRRALRCRACGSDWEKGRCKYCGHDEFVEVTRFYPGFEGPSKGILTIPAGRGGEARGADEAQALSDRCVRRGAPAYHG
jgi:hypothetical protein